MNLPDNLRYTKDHEWVLVEGNTATIGITDFAQSELGDIVYVEVETLEEKTVSDLFMPITGKIIAFNEDLVDAPEAVNDDPYGKGWMIKIEMSQPAEIDQLLSSEAYGSLIGA